MLDLHPDIGRALVTCIQELRKALGDDSKQPLFIETRHRMGYRFVAPIDAPPATGSTGGQFCHGTPESEPSCQALARQKENDPPRSVEFTAVPYYAWDNRGDSEMSVWLPLA